MVQNRSTIWLREQATVPFNLYSLHVLNLPSNWMGFRTVRSIRNESFITLLFLDENGTY